MQKSSGTEKVSSDELTPDDDIYLNPIPGSRLGRIWKTTISIPDFLEFEKFLNFFARPFEREKEVQNSKLREGLEEATEKITLTDQATIQTLEALHVGNEALKKSNGELQDEISRLGTQNQELKDQRDSLGKR